MCAGPLSDDAGRSAPPTLAAMQEGGFPMGGESSIALDLVDTIAGADASSVDLLHARPARWWLLESGRLPSREAPPMSETRRLRGALREAFEACIDGRAPARWAVDDINRFASAASSSPYLRLDGEPRVITVWGSTRGGEANLSAIAHDGIAVLGDPARRSRLRRCANPECSMIFLAKNSRHVWCTSNICGNRMRVARHYRRHHPPETIAETTPDETTPEEDADR